MTQARNRLLKGSRESGRPATASGIGSSIGLGVALASVLWGGGCAPPSPPDVSLFATPCAADTFLDGIRPAVPASYLELRERDGANSFRVVATSGNECLLAGDQDQCSGDFDALPTWPGFHACVGHDCGHSLAVTRAKPMGLYQVESYTDSKKLLAFLGPLDTPADAVLYTYAQGYDFNCTDSDPTLTGGVREAIDGDGFEVLTSLVSHACEPLLVTGYHYHVTTRGDLIMLNSWQVTNDPTVRCN